MRAIAIAAVCAGAAACGPIRGAAPALSGEAAGVASDREVAIVLYKDGALVRDRRWVDVGLGGGAVDVALPDDVKAEDVLIAAGGGAEVPQVAHGGAEIAPGTDARAAIAGIALGGVVRAATGVWVLDDGKALHLVDPPAIAFDARGAAPGPHVRARAIAPQPGRYPIDCIYVTQSLSWRASYTLVGGEPRGMLHGALIVDNRAGAPLGRARITLIDDALGDGAAAVAQAIAKAGADETVATPLPAPIDVGVGELSIDLVGGAREVAVHALLVYDPIGVALDQGGRVPVQAEAYGTGRRSPAVAETAELELGAGARALPTGTVRLVERQPDGTLRLRGQGELRSTAGAATTIAIGRSPDVTGRRERVEIGVDVRAKRLVEEIEVTLDNKGDHAASVLVREHLYRGLTWTLSYDSTDGASKEGPQQIAMRTVVPAHGQAKVVYVVVYTW